MAECSLIIGTGCRVHVFSLILDSSVGLLVGIQSAGDLVSQALGSNPAFSRGEEDNLSPFDSKIACQCQSSIEINNNKYIYIYIYIYRERERERERETNLWKFSFKGRFVRKFDVLDNVYLLFLTLVY